MSNGKPEGAGKPAGGPPGQQKEHEATRINPATGETETKVFTQEEWRARDKSEGWERPEDDDEAAEAEPEGGA